MGQNYTYLPIKPEQCSQIILAWKSPFELYFGRKPNLDQKFCHSLIGSYGISYKGTSKAISDFVEKRKKSRKSAKKATESHSNIVRNKLSHYSVYDLNEKVLVKFNQKKHKVPAKHHILKGIVIKPVSKRPGFP